MTAFGPCHPPPLHLDLTVQQAGALHDLFRGHLQDLLANAILWRKAPSWHEQRRALPPAHGHLRGDPLTGRAGGGGGAGHLLLARAAGAPRNPARAPPVPPPPYLRLIPD